MKIQIQDVGNDSQIMGDREQGINLHLIIFQNDSYAQVFWHCLKYGLKYRTSLISQWSNEEFHWSQKPCLTSPTNHITTQKEASIYSWMRGTLIRLANVILSKRMALMLTSNAVMSTSLSFRYEQIYWWRMDKSHYIKLLTTRYVDYPEQSGHAFWKDTLLGALSTTSWVLSTSIILETRQTSLWAISNQTMWI